jgi:3-oxoacyl-[acyl-carrier-protein] synthase-3
MNGDIRSTRERYHSRILGVGCYRPERIVGNAEIAANTGLSEKWIVERSGIHTRRYAGPQESLPMMASEAGAKALAAAGVDSGDLDCVITATITYLEQMPALAVEVAHRLGATTSAAFDVSAACAGFCHAIELASGMVQLGQARTVLVIGAERMTDILDHHDPDTAFLFADGAGAVVVGRADVPGIGPAIWRADGSKNGALKMSSCWSRDLLANPERWPVIRMSGWKVYRWATSELVAAAHAILDAAGVAVADLDAFIPHQANMLITDYLVDELGLTGRTAVARDIVDAGNTSAASIPLALDRMLADGQIASGGTALLLGFGAGLVFAGQVVRIP